MSRAGGDRWDGLLSSVGAFGCSVAGGIPILLPTPCQCRSPSLWMENPPEYPSWFCFVPRGALKTKLQLFKVPSNPTRPEILWVLVQKDSGQAFTGISCSGSTSLAPSTWNDGPQTFLKLEMMG